MPNKFLQNIQGVQITPSPKWTASRLFPSTNWPKGFAFGGWIYNSNLRLGFSKEPTELIVNIVYETDSQDVNYSYPQVAEKDFWISDAMLEKSLSSENATTYEDENNNGYFFEIDLHGVLLKRMYLYDYEISIESGQKTLQITFKDYSLILNKIYVGLIKRQGPQIEYDANGKSKSIQSWRPPTGFSRLINNEKVKISLTTLELEAYCPNCYLLGGEEIGEYGGQISKFFDVQKGTVKRNLQLGSYAVKYSDVGTNYNDVSTLRYYKEDDQRIRDDQACFNTSEWNPLDMQHKCDSIYGPNSPQANLYAIGLWSSWSGGQTTINGAPIRFHYHPIKMAEILRRGGLTGSEALHDPWMIPEHEYCDGNNNVNQADCERDGGEWKATTNLYPFEFWKDLKNRIKNGDINTRGFTIDGGYVMLGTEEFAEKNCGDLPNISYNFTELIDTLRYHRFKIATTADSGANVDRNPKFRQNYIGTLREVLEQWCGAMSLDFYWDNEAEEIRFVDLQEGANLQPVEDIIDPSTPIGKEFGAENDSSSVIISYKKSSSLQNTNIQRVITSNTKPFTKREKSKDVQRYTPLLPMHPLDFTTPNHSESLFHTTYGEGYSSHRYANIIPWTPHLKTWTLPGGGRRAWAEPDIPNWHEARKRIWYTKRQLWDIDYAMALSKYNKSLREMYVGQRIIENCKSERAGVSYDANGNPNGSILPSVPTEVQNDFEANCQALGFWPLSEIVHPQVKTELIEEFIQGGGNDVQDINLDQRFYKLFIGYYTEQEHEEIVSWEQRCADGMYKYGTVVQGTIPQYPFVPREFYGYKASEAGFSNLKGLSIPKLEHSFSPSAAAYAQCTTCLETFDAPFNGMLIRSGNYLPTGLLFADLQNPWGTNVEDFQIEFNNIFQDNACTKYNNSLNIREDMEDAYPYKTQTWDLEAFEPKFFDDLSEVWVSLEPIFTTLYENGALIDEVSVAGVDINNKFRRTCKKMHLMILTDVTRHENITFGVRSNAAWQNPQARLEMLKWEINEGFRKNKEEYLSPCDIDFNFEFCEEAMLRESNAERTRKYGSDFLESSLINCAISPTGVYKEGFDRSVIGGARIPNTNNYYRGEVNSRSLEIYLARNPAVKPKYPPTDNLGFYYLADLEEDLERLPTREWRKTIIYPVNNFKMYGNFGWLPGDEYETEVANYGGFVPGRMVMNRGFPHYLSSRGHSIGYYGGLGLINSKVDNLGVSRPAGLGNFQCYSGIWNAKVSIEDRRPELTEILGEPIQNGNQKEQFKGNPTEKIKIINNTIDPDLEAQMDPNNNEFVTRIFDADGDELKTIAEYHNYVERGLSARGGLNDYSIIKPSKQISLRIAGSVREFPAFHTAGYVHPYWGLNSYSVSLGSEGLVTDMTYSSRPPQQPELESILNKIGPRIM